jgi:hypothetical protein
MVRRRHPFVRPVPGDNSAAEKIWANDLTLGFRCSIMLSGLSVT